MSRSILIIKEEKERKYWSEKVGIIFQLTASRMVCYQNDIDMRGIKTLDMICEIGVPFFREQLENWEQVKE